MSTYGSSLAIGVIALALSAYLGIARDRSDRRVKRGNYLFGVVFLLFAMWVGNVLVALVVGSASASSNLDEAALLLRIQIATCLFVVVPGMSLLLRLVSMRCRDAGYAKGVAYLGAVPLVQIFFILWLLFPKGSSSVQAANAA